MRESENVVRRCNAMAEEELWSGWTQVQKRAETSTKDIGESPSVESKEKNGRSDTTAQTRLHER